MGRRSLTVRFELPGNSHLPFLQQMHREDEARAGDKAHPGHMAAMVEALRKKSTFPVWPQDTYNAAMRTSGEDQKLELAAMLQVPHDETHIDVVAPGSFAEALPERVHRLSTSPDAFEISAQYLIDQMVDFIPPIRFLPGHIVEVPSRRVRSAVKSTGRRLRDMASHSIKTSAKQGKHLTPNDCLAALLRVCTWKLVDNNYSQWYSGGKWDTHFVMVISPTYELVQELLHEMRSRDMAWMLAHKVAGHILPSELVELIADGYYDKELLASYNL